MGGDALSNRLGSVCLFDGPINGFLDVLGLIGVGNLFGLDGLLQLLPQCCQFAMELLNVRSGVSLADILQASHDVFGDDVLHGFDAPRLLQRLRCVEACLG